MYQLKENYQNIANHTEIVTSHVSISICRRDLNSNFFETKIKGPLWSKLCISSEI